MILSREQVMRFLTSRATNSSYFRDKAVPHIGKGNIHHKIHGFQRFTDAEIDALSEEITKFLNHVYIGTKYK
jgi:hypothetical protein